MAQTIQREAQVVLNINDKEAENKLAGLEKKARKLRERFAEAFKNGDTKGIEKINRELTRVNKEIDRTRTQAQRIKAAMKELDQASPKELQRTISLITAELNSGKIRRGSKEWDAHVAKLKEVKLELNKVRAEMAIIDNNRGFFTRMKDGFNEWGGAIATAAAAFAGVVMSGKAAVKTYAEMQAEEANVRKYTGMTADEVARLNEEFKKMDTRTSREELNRLAQEAGRLGKASVEDVLGFVKAADKINVALDDLGDGATLTLSKLTGIFGDEKLYGTEQSLLKVGSVINELSQNCSSSAPYLAQFASRLGGIAAQSNMTISQVMAFAAVLDTQNLAVEASATAMGQLITKIYQDPQKMAKAAGLEVKKFTELVKTDMNSALLMLFENLNKYGGMEKLASVFDNMGTDGARAIPVLAALAGHVEELKWEMDEANKAFKEGTSVGIEFDVQNTTVQAGLDKARKGFNEMAVALGEKLVPVMRHCISGTSMMMRTLSVLVDFFIKYKKEIITLTAVIGTYNAIIAVHNARTKIAVTWVGFWTAAQTKLNGVVAVGKLLMAAMTNAVQYFTNGLKVNYAMQQRWRSALEGMKFAHWTGLILAMAAAAVTLYNKITSITAVQKAFRDVEADSAKAVKNTTDKIKEYQSIIENNKASLVDRYDAIKKLKEIMGDYNGELDKEGRLINHNAKAIDDYIKKLREKAYTNALEEKMTSSYKELVDKAQKLAEHLDYGDKEDFLTRIYSGQIDPSMLMRRSAGFLKTGTFHTTATDENNKRFGVMAMGVWSAEELDEYNDALKVTLALQQAVGQNRSKELLSDRRERETYNAKLYSSDKDYKKEVDEILKSTGDKLKASDGSEKSVQAIEDLKEMLFKQLNDRFADKITSLAKEVETITPPEKEDKKKDAKARAALKKELDERKALYLQEQADNEVMYYTGVQNYEEFCKKKINLEEKYNDDIIDIHKKHNTLDKVAYAKALSDKADLLRKSKAEETKISLEALDKEHKAKENDIVFSFYDPNGPVFQNQRALNQKLLEEDIRYLRLKAALYNEGAKERAAVEKQIAERLESDKLAKQKEMISAYNSFVDQYRNSSGSAKEKMEIALLDQLMEQQLITEQEYQQAVDDLKEKYQKADIERARKTQSVYVDMVLNIYQSFTKLFDSLGKEGTNFWDDLSSAATAAYAVMSAGLSQYSAYMSAERDVELEKTEARYEREIEAAGNNTKRREQLEKQKEEETAKIKKKYNDRSMKVELAQAIAQTAQAAIAAYASAAAVPVTGWIMAPIAASLATAAGLAQVATIKKQHEAESVGYYEGGFTSRSRDNRKEVGVVHANEFVANHQAVGNPALLPVLNLIDHAQRNNTVGSLTSDDVQRVLGTKTVRGGAGGETSPVIAMGEVRDAVTIMSTTTANMAEVVELLTGVLNNGIEAKVILDGEDGFHKKYTGFTKLIDNPKR